MKTYSNRKFRFFVAIVTILTFIIPAFGQDKSLGIAEVKVSGAEIAMPYFEKGLLLLYSFQYEDAQKEFEMAQLMDPDMAMAYWGEAMCYSKGLWHIENTKKGRGLLYKLGMTTTQRLEKAATDIEKGFIESLEMLYAKDVILDKRHEQYMDYMGSFYNKYPANAEIAVFYALALLERSPMHVAEDYESKAQKVLQKVLDRLPDHPGALNLMIHASDSPDKAYKGLFAAQNYPIVVNSLPYALHLPSHIYLDLGRWQDMVTANEQAWNLSRSIVKKDKLGLEDLDYHSYWWLLYGYLQQGRYEKAATMVKSISQNVAYTNALNMRYHLAMMKGAFLVETGLWKDRISKIDVLTVDFNIKTKALCFFIDGMSALALNDIDRTGWSIIQITDQKSVEVSGGGEIHPDYYYCNGESDAGIVSKEQDLIASEVIRLELEAVLAMKKKDIDLALDFAKRASQLQDKFVLPPGPPIIVKPARELYGELLTDAGQPEAALEQFDLALRMAPNRTLSLLGKYRAYRALDKKEKMASMKKMIKSNWEHADPGVWERLNK